MDAQLKKNLVGVFRDFLIYVFLCVGTFLMLRIITEYVTFSSTAGFLKQKQDYIHISIWKVAFYTHVFSSGFTLLAGFTQFSNYILTRYKKLHKVLGRCYAWNIFLINFPSGFIMAIYANGYWPSKIAFLILDCLWFAFTLKAVIEIKRKNVQAHQEYMIRSYALTCSAITLRTWRMVLANLFMIDPVTLYMIDAWLGFVPNLLFAEWLVRSKRIEMLS